MVIDLRKKVFVNAGCRSMTEQLSGLRKESNALFIAQKEMGVVFVEDNEFLVSNAKLIKKIGYFWAYEIPAKLLN